MVAQAGLSPVQRRELLDDYAISIGGALEMGDRFERLSGLEAERAWRNAHFHANQGKRTRDSYMQSLPNVRLTRCPFTEQELVMPMDTDGLDGLWWEYDRPARPAGDAPPSFIGITGALKLGSAVESTHFLVMPGPEVPYVLPELLQVNGVKAVISSMAIGAHTGYAVAYFAEGIERRLPKPATWGARPAYYRTAEDELATDEIGITESEMDFDLSKWTDQGKLLWIAPGDDGLELRGSTDKCPYLGLPGRRALTYIQDGRVWSSDGITT